MPNPNPKETKEEYIARFMSSEEAKKDYPDEKQRLAVAHSKWKQFRSKTKELDIRFCINGLKIKEENDSIIVTGLVATTHPDRAKDNDVVGDILSEKSIKQIVNYINETDTVGGQKGSYRSVSLFHDWIKQGNPTLDEAAFLKPTAREVQLDDGHYGVEVDAEINKYYKGDMTPDEIKYRIDNGQIAGFSIEYDTDENHSKIISHNSQNYRFIDSLTEFGGVGFARARTIANPHAVIYKEIVDEVNNMVEENKTELSSKEVPVNTTTDVKIESKETLVADIKSDIKLEVKEEVKSEMKETDFDNLVKQVKEHANELIDIKSKIVKQTKESEVKEMETKELPLSIKEMKESISGGKMDLLRFKEAVSTYFAENPELDLKLKEQYMSTGIVLRPRLQTKCVNNKLVISGGLQIKSTLDTTTNAGAYTESPVEFADLFIPGLVETFNNQATLFGAVRKVNHLMGGNMFGWRITTDQASSLAVDPDDPTVVKDPVNKLKLHTEIKEYRIGVSVSDYTLWHARATMGDLLAEEANKRMQDLIHDINTDMYTEQVDTAGNKILGLESVADSAGNASMYGKTRSTANRLAPAAAGDTYNNVAGALTTVAVRDGLSKVEIAGALRGNLRIVTSPAVRDDLFELLDGQQQLYAIPQFGFSGQLSFDGVPIIVDSFCPSDSLFVIDDECYYLVISRGPQLIGLAKVGAAEEAYVSVYLAAVYEQPRRIHMLNGLA